MQCSKCRNDGIVFQPYSGQHLCRGHFIADFEAKAKRAIRVNRWMQPGDHIGVVTRRDFAGNALLSFFQKLTGNRKDIRVSEITGTEDLPGLIVKARNAGLTRIAFATPLEDAAASALTAILRGRADACFSDASPIPGEIQVITPFCHIPAGEIVLYARIHGLAGDGMVLPQENNTLYTEIKALLADYSRRHPAAPHAVLNLCETLAFTKQQDGGVFP